MLASKHSQVRPSFSIFLLLSFIIFLVTGFFVGSGYADKKHADKRHLFFSSILPYLGALEEYPEIINKQVFLDSVETSNIDSLWYDHPRQYLSFLHKEFSEAVNVFYTTNLKNKEILPLSFDSDAILTQLSTSDKVAQLFIFGIDGTQLSRHDRSFLEQERVGGIILMGENISSSLHSLVRDLQSTNTLLPLFISIDQEGGPVTRVKEDLPGQTDVTLENMCDSYKERSKLLTSYGINMNFGIVADVSQDANSFIYPRTFRDNPSEQVARAISCTHNSLLTTLKHFPGHGGTALDTHQGYARIAYQKDYWKSHDWEPFALGIEAGADLIMMGHLIAPFLGDEKPGTLSPSQHNYLREQGFTGLIITDDMDMIRSNYDRQEALTQAIVAGNDILLYVSSDERDVLLAHARKLIAHGVISLEELDQRVLRIIEKKRELTQASRYLDHRLLDLNYIRETFDSFGISADIPTTNSPLDTISPDSK